MSTLREASIGIRVDATTTVRVMDDLQPAHPDDAPDLILAVNVVGGGRVYLCGTHAAISAFLTKAIGELAIFAHERDKKT